MSAFAQAMFDQLRQPDRDVKFRMRIVGGPGMDCRCRDFLYLRTEEQSLIRECVGGRQEPRVLDIGCGIGRHSLFARSLAPHARISVVEIDQQLRDYCIFVVPGAVAYEQFSDVPADAQFDIVFLMGNGLGVFGSEPTTRQQLQRLHTLLADGACVLIESGNFTADSYYADQHEIAYDGSMDRPFTWGYATFEWLQRELVNAGFVVSSVTPSSRGGPFLSVLQRDQPSKTGRAKRTAARAARSRPSCQTGSAEHETSSTLICHWCPDLPWPGSRCELELPRKSCRLASFGIITQMRAG